MYSFSEYDRKVILAIANEDSLPRLLGDIFTTSLSHLDEYALLVTRDPFVCHVLEPSQTESSALQYNIVDFISIISYLKDNGYIVLVDSPSVWGRLYYNGATIIKSIDDISPVDSKKIFTNTFDNEYCINFSPEHSLTFVEKVKDGFPISIGDVRFSNRNIELLATNQYGHNLISQLKEILGSFAYPTSKLINLVNNEFQSQEDLYNNRVLAKADKQIQKAQIAVVIAIITLLINAIGVLCKLLI